MTDKQKAEEIKIAVISEDDRESLSILLSEYTRWNITEDVIMIGAFDRTELVGLVVLRRLTDDIPVAYVEFIYALTGYEKKGVYKKLMQSASYIATKCDFIAIYYKLYALDEKKNEAFIRGNEVLSLAKYSVSSFLMYPAESIRKSRMAELILPIKDKLPKTLHLGKEEYDSLKKYSNRCLKTGFCFIPEYYDQEYTSFYRYHGDITGALLTYRVTDSLILTYGARIFECENKINVGAALTADLIDILVKNPKKNIRIGIYAENEKKKEAVKKVFGEWNDRIYYQEYLFLLDRKDLYAELDAEDFETPEHFSIASAASDIKKQVDDDSLPKTLLRAYYCDSKRIPGPEILKEIYSITPI